jgi:quercetin dioxygenase-like cupin family protein
MRSRSMAAVSTPVPIVRAAADGERRWFYGGGVHTWKATARETGGAFLLFEAELDRAKVTPLHLHPDADETMYMLEGEILVHIDGQEHRVGPSGIAVAPRGVPHAFLVVSETARMLCLLTPGHGEEFYRDASELMSADRPDPDVVDFARVQASAEKNGGIEILGPPPFHRP